MADALYDAILGDQTSKSTTPSSVPPKSSGTNQFNVGNLRPVGQSTGFQQPASYEEGIRALDKNLEVYGTKHNINTLRGVISRYAPSSENDTEAYIKYVAQKTGLKPDQEIDLTNPAVRHVISGPMILMEKGNKAIFAPSSTQQKQTKTVVSEDPLYNAILSGEVKENKISKELTQEEKDYLASPVQFNPNLRRQGQKMREKGSKLQPFVEQVAKPLEAITAEDYAKNSTPFIIAKLNFGTPEQKQEALETVYQGTKKFVGGVADFINAPNKGEIIKKALQEISDNPGRFVGESVKSIAYHPEQIYLGNVAAKATGDVIGKGVDVVKKGAQVVAETPAYQGLKSTAKTSMEVMQEGFEAAKKANAPKGAITENVTPAGASVGAAQTSNQTIINEALTRATPELAAEIKKLNPREVNIEVLNRHLDADTLPVPMKLSEGMATRDPKLFSDEMNSRGKNRQYADEYNRLNSQLVENIDAIKEKASPNVYGTNVVENGQSLIDAYLDIDKARKANIASKYETLKDAAGGAFPIDSKKFYENAFANLDKELKTEFLPDSIKKQVDGFKDGKPMTFQQFEALRTNLATEMRKADRAGDGNAEFALSTVRQALEDLPLVNESKQLKSLADEARSAAKERFDILDSDKAYKAAVNGKVYADDFINKFVVNGKKTDIDKMVNHLGVDSQAREVMAAGIVNWLKSKAGISADGTGTFSQKGYNKALESIDPKILNIVGAEVDQQLKQLGRTARNIQERPVGAYVNESNTFVARLAEKAKSGAEIGINYMAGGYPLGTMARNAASNIKESKRIKESLKPGAGIKLKDIGKE